MKKVIFFVAAISCIIIQVNSQILYVPSGTNGIGTSNLSGVGSVSLVGSLPSDLWVGSQAIAMGNGGSGSSTQGFVGHLGSYDLDLFWNFYRTTSAYAGLNTNGFTNASAIRLGNMGITFNTIDVMGTTLPTERMRITTTGSIGIGTTSPSAN